MLGERKMTRLGPLTLNSLKSTSENQRAFLMALKGTFIFYRHKDQVAITQVQNLIAWVAETQ